MHHSKALVFTFLMMLIFLAVLFRSIITAHYIWSTPYHWPFSYYRIMIIFESESFKPSILKLQSKIALSFLLFVTYNVHSNDRMATGYVDSIFKAQCGILMTSLKLTTTSFRIHCRILISENILFLSIVFD